ncbi:MAG: hypothetical protein UR39_C0011G0020 [Candidatus Woesebacteria bacterium GW2011_GWA1_33_30]|uniref:PrsW family intramembrane metalloprotease n=1 Tax=Candidatus Woesebacteria bacterium GW2011_GWA2_33_28 TaxID=1618561 RepID=A0A0F9ZQ11_9BACT|nr:MAG: hypothetical protein UR38_C0011G0018 [Candidatus Woesebacteria bacterium GW2011_GWA2_33_28]KKP47068.1 MAG: hypothetical protein UR39_C0011G0020 [Candidatus Woesebacteria bacterium GW2011_GWA1_33_30]KKP48682.1 MAG: hypothetical protein UR40_C0012G0018 [Microgenomates group bacterium GW2011_GWC1_33_32]KKP51391.1 MAG: hypothetical protein UR44_C0011G0018 [Candidatus Woesebacteria bacterium GW2011_GWB1_33_38]KKP57430.1 MAG: hypothetical protein UR48_C0017G0003 [Microgenomates group bacteriu
MVYLFSLIGPFFLLLVEKFLPYPYFIEELYKLFLAKSTSSTRVVIILGFLFSFSEAVFYFLNPNPSFFRFLVVTPMHITTLLVMQYFNEIQLRHKRNLWWLGLTLAILIHYLFNQISLAGSEPVM